MSDQHFNDDAKKEISIALEPWINVSDGPKALQFYSAAFDAVETYRMEEGGLVLKLNMGNAAFWISGPLSGDGNANISEQKTIRMVLTVPDPEKIFAKAIRAGAKEIFPIGEEYGWLLGRIVDPFGIHWEIGHPL